MKALAVIPVFRSFDESKAREFYLNFLGFGVDFEHRFAADFPLFLQVSRGGFMLRLSEHHADACPGSAVTVAVENVTSFCDELRAKNYRYAKPSLEKASWGALQMTVSDPFGNRITFCEEAES
jgi:uncharacterized glyoxalase superfamily protein PhnB